MRSDLPRRGRSGPLPRRRLPHVRGASVALAVAVAGLAGTAAPASAQTTRPSAVVQADPEPNKLCPPWLDCGAYLPGPSYDRPPPHHEDGPPQHEAPEGHEGDQGHDGHGRPGPPGPQGPAGPTGPTGPAGPAGPASTFETVGDPMTLVRGEEGTVFATCPAGSTLVSGGYLMSGTMQVLLTSRAATPNTWTVTVLNNSTTNATVAAVAQCARHDRKPGPSARP
ncbi:hypothetical protein ACWGE1_38170 [Streptomyces sp. NPDC054932]